MKKHALSDMLPNAQELSANTSYFTFSIHGHLRASSNVTAPPPAKSRNCFHATTLHTAEIPFVNSVAGTDHLGIFTPALNFPESHLHKALLMLNSNNENH